MHSFKHPVLMGKRLSLGWGRGWTLLHGIPVPVSSLQSPELSSEQKKEAEVTVHSAAFPGELCTLAGCGAGAAGFDSYVQEQEVGLTLGGRQTRLAKARVSAVGSFVAVGGGEVLAIQRTLEPAMPWT